jgi:FtsZ-binding cell division protein ZapB
MKLSNEIVALIESIVKLQAEIKELKENSENS